MSKAAAESPCLVSQRGLSGTNSSSPNKITAGTSPANNIPRHTSSTNTTRQMPDP